MVEIGLRRLTVFILVALAAIVLVQTSGTCNTFVLQSIAMGHENFCTARSVHPLSQTPTHQVS